MRPEEMDDLLLPHGLKRERLEDLSFNYLTLYHKK